MSNISPIQAALTQALSGPGKSAASAPSNGAQFSEIITKMLEKTSTSQEVASDLSSRLQIDDPNVSVEQTVLASNEASLNFEFTLQTRNKLVKAYNDLMNMPV